jgi:hypothetical protein
MDLREGKNVMELTVSRIRLLLVFGKVSVREDG